MEGMQTSRRMHSEHVPFSPLVPITVSLIAEMSPGGSHPSAMLHQTDVHSHRSEIHSNELEYVGTLWKASEESENIGKIWGRCSK